MLLTINKRSLRKVTDWISVIWLVALVTSIQYLIYWLLSTWAMELFPEYGKFILISIIAFSFFVLASAVGYAITNAGNSMKCSERE